MLPVFQVILRDHTCLNCHISIPGVVTCTFLSAVSPRQYFLTRFLMQIFWSISDVCIKKTQEKIKQGSCTNSSATAMSLESCGIYFVFIRACEFTPLSVHFPFLLLKPTGSFLISLRKTKHCAIPPIPTQTQQILGFSKGSEQRMSQQQIIYSHLEYAHTWPPNRGHLHLSQSLQDPSPLPGWREAGASSCPRHFLGGGLGASSGSGTGKASQSPCSLHREVSSD